MNLCTLLKNRVLRYDGVSIIEPESLLSMLRFGVEPAALRVTEITDEIQEFNSHVSPDDQLREYCEEPITLNLRWLLPSKYANLDLRSHVLQAFEKHETVSTYSPELREKALQRIDAELQEIQVRGMVEFFRTVCYVLDEFRRTETVWGVGRGSSCASYILFVLGLHVVDAVRFEVPLEEFFH